MSYSYRSIVDGGADSDMIYYNASIVATQQSDLNPSGTPIQIRFNETRDAPIVKDASQYYFSIIRFSMNGPNKNLPLFIPIVQLKGFNYQVQSNPNLTIYYASIPYQRSWYVSNGVDPVFEKLFTIIPPSTPLIYIPETQNTLVAPVPLAPALGFGKQDLTTRYYWVYTYKHWVELINNTFSTAMLNVYNAFLTTWNNGIAAGEYITPFPYPTYQDFLAVNDAPYMYYDEDTKTFSIYGDTRAFNISGQLTGALDLATGRFVGTQESIPAWDPNVAVVEGTPASQSYLRLFMNGDLYNLFSSFNNTYYGATNGSILPMPIPPITALPNPLPQPILNSGPYLYTNEILFKNQQYTNILNNNPTLQGVQAVPPPAYNPLFLIPTNKQQLYWISKQDYNTTNSLWSPIASLVFTSALLPIKKEYTSQPTQLGSTNAFSTTGSPSAFEPIITDYAIDQQAEKPEGWRDFVLYEPSAEYKLSSMVASHDEIRNIDIQVFWKYRLTGELIPLTMVNCSDVTFKMMFRKVDFRS